MDKVASSVVVLMTTFIAAAIASFFVFGRTGMLSGYSSDVQNSSVCEGLATRAEPGTDEAEQYEEKGCDEIYGDIQYTSQVEENSELMNGVTLNVWEQYAHYDTTHEFDFTIDFQELDGNEYIFQREPSFGGDQFVYNEDYNYKVDLFIRHPTEGGSDQDNSWIWNIEPEECDGSVCHYKQNFTYSEHEGNLSNNFLPCQNEDGSNDNLVQRLSVRAEGSNGRAGWVVVQEHNMTMIDWSGTECWQDNSLPSFENGKIIVKSMNISDTINVDDNYTFKLDVDYDNDSLSADKLSIRSGIPDQSGDTRYELNLDETSGCTPWCQLQFNVSVVEGLNTPECYSFSRESDDISHDTVEFFLREKPSGDDHLIYNESVIGDYPYGTYTPYCWQGFGDRGGVPGAGSGSNGDFRAR